MKLSEIKQHLQSLFEADFQGVDLFVQNVIEPIFEDGYNSLLARADILEGKSKKAVEGSNIISAYQVGEIDTFTTIRLYDITLADNANIARSRVGIQRFVRHQIPTDTQAFILFHYEHPEGRSWRLSYLYKNTSQADTTPAKRYTYLFSSDSHARTAIDRFATLVGKDMVDEKPLLNAFSVETLSDEFFYEYREHYADFVQYVTGKRYVKRGKEWKEIVVHAPNEEFYNAFGRNDKRVRDYVKKMMGRLVFLCFLQRKGWMGNSDNEYLFNLYANSADDVKTDFLDRVLEPMFFGLLNTKPEERKGEFARQGWDLSLIADAEKIPYLNGGLFEQDENDKVRSVFPCELFSNPTAKEEPKKYTTETFDYTTKRGLFDFFSAYNFTIDENDPDDAEVGVDPEMLGRIFENLLEDNKDKGAFYTPKEIVQYMCRESLIAYLQTDEKDEDLKLQIREFVTTNNADLLSADLTNGIDQKLKDVKICDPAIGSGAFPMGLLRELFLCRSALEGFEHDQAADIKRHIIQNNIYGVDIEKGAVDIARLRFWLSLIINEESPRALPNLDFKIMQGNSLLEQYKIDEAHTITLDDIIKENQKQVVHAKEKSPLFEGQDVISDLKKTLYDYYTISDHDEKQKTKSDIEECVRQYIEIKILKTYSKRSQVVEKITALDKLSETKIINSNFFLWHTWFADVFEEGKGFDIVIGNPPYIDSETMVKGMPETRIAYANKFKTAKGNWDIYIPFYELGLEMLNTKGKLAFITPNKWVSIGYGKKLRELYFDNFSQVCDCSSIKVFEAGNEPLICFFDKVKTSSIRVWKAFSDKFVQVDNVSKTRLSKDSLGMLLSRQMDLLLKVCKAERTVADFSKAENPFTTSEAYELCPYVKEISAVNQPYYILINTGTIDPFVTLWGSKTTSYLKSKYANPVVTRNDFASAFPRRVRQTASKIVITGMRYFEAYYDNEGKCIAGKSTIIIPQNDCDEQDMIYLLAILNAKIIQYYINQSYSALGIDGGINFSVDIVNALPIPLATANEKKAIVECTNILLRTKKTNPLADTTVLESEIDRLVYELYGLTEEEIAIVEGTKPETKNRITPFAKEFQISQKSKNRSKTAAKGLITG